MGTDKVANDLSASFRLWRYESRGWSPSPLREVSPQSFCHVALPSNPASMFRNDRRLYGLYWRRNRPWCSTARNRRLSLPSIAATLGSWGMDGASSSAGSSHAASWASSIFRRFAASADVKPAVSRADVRKRRINRRFHASGHAAPTSPAVDYRRTGKRTNSRIVCMSAPTSRLHNELAAPERRPRAAGRGTPVNSRE